MSDQSKKSHAREGRGAGNGHNDNWRNSPLWDNIGPDANKPKTEEVVEQKPLDELSERERMRRLQQMAY